MPDVPMKIDPKILPFTGILDISCALQIVPKQRAGPEPVAPAVGAEPNALTLYV